MIVFTLPDLYKKLQGQSKKRTVWAYMQYNHPEYDPIKEQPYLFTDNQLIVEYNPVKAKQLTERYWAGKKENAERKKKK